MVETYEPKVGLLLSLLCLLGRRSGGLYADGVFAQCAYSETNVYR